MKSALGSVILRLSLSSFTQYSLISDILVPFPDARPTKATFSSIEIHGLFYLWGTFSFLLQNSGFASAFELMRMMFTEATIRSHHYVLFT